MANTTFDTPYADPKVLADAELLAWTKYWRNRLVADSLHAGARSQIAEVVIKFERELSARFGGTTTIASHLEPPPVSKSWWNRR
ncbi:hypothetical protein [Variovorax sp. SRS16]|uniref:hypothetical protein n=1 Tax=Variovorax sp. SRS16 TaxID=282217 RepID=UPI001E331E4B|nr:hypothetical protein [Variovorax sp. SRS16]